MDAQTLPSMVGIEVALEFLCAANEKLLHVPVLSMRPGNQVSPPEEVALAGSPGILRKTFKTQDPP